MYYNPETTHYFLKLLVKMIPLKHPYFSDHKYFSFCWVCDSNILFSFKKQLALAYFNPSNPALPYIIRQSPEKSKKTKTPKKLEDFLPEKVPDPL